jgi:hypothetical protein
MKAQFTQIVDRKNDMETETIISVETRKFRTFFEALCNEYGSKLVIEINGKKYLPEEHPWLISNWCNRKSLGKTINFSATVEGEVIFAFHDAPAYLRASPSQVQFLKRLQEQEVIKYKTFECQKPVRLHQRLLAYFRRRKTIRKTMG